jgi:DNA-binding XRE family transcriptional regulator
VRWAAPPTQSLAPLLDVRDIRRKLGLTRAQLAKKLRVGVATLREWEHGRGQTILPCNPRRHPSCAGPARGRFCINDAQGYGCFSFTSSSGAAHGKGSIFISEASSTRGPIPLGQK